MMPELRPYQTDVIVKFDACPSRCVLMVAPTGAGKTVIAGAIVRSYVERGKRVLFFSHRREITKQTSTKLHAVGIDHGIIQAGFPLRLYEPVQVASVQTLTARAIRGSAIDLPLADLVIIDEAHHTPAETYRKIVDKYPDGKIMGADSNAMSEGRAGVGRHFRSDRRMPSGR